MTEFEKAVLERLDAIVAEMKTAREKRADAQEKDEDTRLIEGMQERLHLISVFERIPRKKTCTPSQ